MANVYYGFETYPRTSLLCGGSVHTGEGRNAQADRLRAASFVLQADFMNKKELEAANYIRFLENQLHQALSAAPELPPTAAPPSPSLAPPQEADAALDQKLSKLSDLMIASTMAQQQQQQGLQQAAMLQFTGRLHQLESMMAAAAADSSERAHVGAKAHMRSPSPAAASSPQRVVSQRLSKHSTPGKRSSAEAGAARHRDGSLSRVAGLKQLTARLQRASHGAEHVPERDLAATLDKLKALFAGVLSRQLHPDEVKFSVLLV